MKMKKLLASALAATMVLSTMVGALVSAAKTVGTITAGDVTYTVGDTDTITTEINIEFTEGIVAPHNIITVALEGYTLSNVALGTVEYADGSAEGVVSIDADGSNLAAGKVLLEAPVDSKAPTVLAIALTATFVDADDDDTAVGTYDIVVNGADMTDVNEAEIGIDAVKGTLTVAEAAHVCTPAEAVKENEKAADCTTDGSYDLVVYCSECDKEISRTPVTVDALGHTAGEAVEENRNDATCAVDGSYDTVVYCTVCETEMSRTPATIPATGNHTAGEAKEENRKDATCGADGSYDAVVYCTVCNKELSRTPSTIPATGAHNYEEGVCGTCGAEDPNYEPPVADPVPVDFTLRNPALMVKEKYGFRIRMDFGANGYTDANGKTVKYDHYEIELNTQEYVGSNYTLTPVNKVFTVSEKDESSTSARDYYFYKNVTAYALNLPINLTVKFYDAQNNYVAYSNTLTFSIAGLTKEKLAAASTASNLKKVYMDMLNYGAATQVYFSQFGTNNPLKTAESIIEGCEDYQKYATQDIPTLGGVNNSNDVAGTGFVITPGLQASSSNNIYYRFAVPTTLDVNNLTVTLTHTDLYGKPVINTYALKDMSKDNKGRYVLAYDQVAIFDSAAVVTAVINDASNATNPIYSFDYNIDYYVNSKVTAANPDAVYVALAKFSVSSMEYFKTLI